MWWITKMPSENGVNRVTLDSIVVYLVLIGRLFIAFVSACNGVFWYVNEKIALDYTDYEPVSVPDLCQMVFYHDPGAREGSRVDRS